MRVLTPYDQLYTTDKTYILMKSGRNGGKSKATAQYIVRRFFEEDGDFVITRAYSQDLRDSLYSEILTVIDEIDREHGTKLYEQIKTGTRPLKISNMLNGNVIHFLGIGGPDIDRSKGYTSKKKWTAIVVEEMQQIKNENNLNEALETFVRNMKDSAKVIMMFNPPRRASHWVNELFRLKKHNDDDYFTLYTTYKDIAGVLNRHTLARIEAEKEVNPTDYRHRFLGETEGLFGSVYASFDRNIHVISEDFAKNFVKKIGIYSFLIGADPAATRDATALVPILLLRNGQMVVVDYFYHDPKKDGVITNDKLAPIVKEWIDWLLDKWGMTRNMRVSMVFDTNGVSQDLMRTIQYRFPANIETAVYSQKRVIEMADVVKDAFSRNLMFIVDSGGYRRFTKVTGKNQYEFTDQNFVVGVNHAITQLEQVIWNEAGDGFDKDVPNDVTDALTYGTVFYLKNKGNMYFPTPQYFYKPLEVKDKEGNDEN